jgi:hypothetical protein
MISASLDIGMAMVCASSRLTLVTFVLSHSVPVWALAVAMLMKIPMIETRPVSLTRREIVVCLFVVIIWMFLVELR